MFTIIDSEHCFSRGISPYELKKGEFSVCQPYFKSKEGPAVKKKIANNPSNTDLETKKRHEFIKPLLTTCLHEIQAEWPWKETKTTDGSNDDSDESNMIDFPSIQDMVETAHFKFGVQEQEEKVLEEYVLDQSTMTELDLFSIFHTCFVNKSKQETKLLQLTPEANYIIPPNSTFMMGSLENTIDSLGSYVKQLGGADLIVIDPPWPNKSVHRSARYETQDIYDLFRLPIPAMTHGKDSIVAVWVTNKPKFRNFILNKLFPAWDLECVGEWVWLKMTTQAEPIFPIDSEHKKPYEQLIIGRPKKSPSHRIPMPESHIIASIPSKKHSRKPLLEDILSKYIFKSDDSVVYLELFARCLLPGWISWGNECLKFQHVDYFDKQE